MSFPHRGARVRVRESEQKREKVKERAYVSVMRVYVPRSGACVCVYVCVSV